MPVSAAERAALLALRRELRPGIVGELRAAGFQGTAGELEQAVMRQVRKARRTAAAAAAPAPKRRVRGRFASSVSTAPAGGPSSAGGAAAAGGPPRGARGMSPERLVGLSRDARERGVRALLAGCREELMAQAAAELPTADYESRRLRARQLARRQFGELPADEQRELAAECAQAEAPVPARAASGHFLPRGQARKLRRLASIGARQRQRRRATLRAALAEAAGSSAPATVASTVLQCLTAEERDAVARELLGSEASGAPATARLGAATGRLLRACPWPTGAAAGCCAQSP
jgi:hypothetical protein